MPIRRSTVLVLQKTQWNNAFHAIPARPGTDRRLAQHEVSISLLSNELRRLPRGAELSVPSKLTDAGEHVGPPKMSTATKTAQARAGCLPQACIKPPTCLGA